MLTSDLAFSRRRALGHASLAFLATVACLALACLGVHAVLNPIEVHQIRIPFPGVAVVSLPWLVAIVVYRCVRRRSQRDCASSTSGPVGHSAAPALYARPALPMTSLRWPVAIFALFLPLSVHGLFFPEAKLFFGWFGLSAIIVPHAHFVFAYLVARNVDELVHGDPAPVGIRVLKTASLAALTAAVPGAVLLMLPPVITAVTAVAISWPLYALAQHLGPEWASPEG